MRWTDTCDSVVMLTWSNWRTEPRSNRYHYATRFARHVPVYFVQPDGSETPTIEPVDNGISIVHVSPQSTRLRIALRRQGCRRPLLWIYNPHFGQFISAYRSAPSIYHATENYLLADPGVTITSANDVSALRATLPQCDLVVAVCDAVAATYGAIHPRVVTLRNGCDYQFWASMAASDFRSPGCKAALFQGGINQRLDYDLLLRVVDKLPEWQFWFAGRSDGAPVEWDALKSRPNVVHYGFVPPKQIAILAQQSRVGIIPFKRERLLTMSLPLKAYEYVACGLPVVSTPIDELHKRPDLFAIAADPDNFAKSISERSDSRTNPDAVRHRLAAASACSYDECFERLNSHLDAICLEKPAAKSLITRMLATLMDTRTN